MQAQENELDQNEQIRTGTCLVHFSLLIQIYSLTFVAYYHIFQCPTVTGYPILPWKFGLYYRIQIRDLQTISCPELMLPFRLL